jgi:predicted amidohydrolase
VSSLEVALVQQASSLDPAENRYAVRSALKSVAARGPMPGLVVLPEAFARDFGKPGSDVSGFAEDLDGPFVSAVADAAAEHGTTVVAGMFERSGDAERPYNTLVVVGPDGLRATYRKIHLYDSFGYRESDRLLAGATDPVVIDIAGVPVGLMTCYDLRFPEMARRLTDRGAELLVLPAAWVAGEGKVHHWRTLVTARAIENTVYVAACGQPGPRYSGHSMVVDPAGRTCATEAGEDEALVTATVDHALLEKVRALNPSLANRRL